MTSFLRRLLPLGVVVSMLAAMLTPTAPAAAQVRDPRSQARALLDQLSPRERVGQLFMVTFKGQSFNTESQIYDLIVKQHIGGVVLSKANDNFMAEETVSNAYQLNAALQSAAWLVDHPTEGTPTPVSSASNYVPLFIGISQEGDLSPNDQIINGATPLPSQMAIGATWQTLNAQQTGSVLGAELSAMGFNLLLGPSLDVLDIPQSEGGRDLGTRTFGGDPYWVGQFGQAFVRGVHQGSNNRMAVIAKHFPGRGSSDRPPEEEVTTVRKSLEQLKQIELAPFFAVTGNAPDAQTTVDGLLVSHIRYQGFQGNIRAITPPVSFDRTALSQVMSLDALVTWREEAQGLIVSDDLGSSAVRKFYDPTNQSFDARQVARSAFLAGNDLLYVGNFVATTDPDSYTTIVRTLDLFTQKYNEDPSFAQQVNASVERILTLKYRLYGTFEISSILPTQAALVDVGKADQITYNIARNAATLISPSTTELSAIVPQPPQTRDNIVFITDTIGEKQCSACPEQTILGTPDFANAVLRLYGQQAGGQISAARLLSYSTTDLLLMLQDPAAGFNLETSLRQANWIVVAITDIRPDRPASMALKQLLAARADLLANKRIIVFALSAPYFLDATDISMLTAYYGIYGKSSSFIDIAARILFQEITPTGALPVSVSGVNYDLIAATSPDPSQVIPLYLDLPETPQTTPDATITPEPTAVPSFRVGDSLPLRTGIILDHNRNPVPDGTVVRFLFSNGADSTIVQQIETTTSSGIARASYRISSQGTLDIRVISDTAVNSQVLRLDVIEGQAAIITAVVPTEQPTETPTATLSPSPTPESTAVIVALEDNTPRFIHWLLSVVATWAGAAGIYWVGKKRISLLWGLRWGLLAAAGGAVAFITLQLVLPAQNAWFNAAGIPVVLGLTMSGVLLGWIAGMVWQQSLRKRAQYTPAPRTPGRSP